MPHEKQFAIQAQVGERIRYLIDGQSVSYQEYVEAVRIAYMVEAVELMEQATKLLHQALGPVAVEDKPR